MEKGVWVRTIQEQVKRLSESPFYLKRFRPSAWVPAISGNKQPETRNQT